VKTRVSQSGDRPSSFLKRFQKELWKTKWANRDPKGVKEVNGKKKIAKQKILDGEKGLGLEA